MEETQEKTRDFNRGCLASLMAIALFVGIAIAIYFAVNYKPPLVKSIKVVGVESRLDGCYISVSIETTDGADFDASDFSVYSGDLPKTAYCIVVGNYEVASYGFDNAGKHTLVLKFDVLTVDKPVRLLYQGDEI